MPALRANRFSKMALIERDCKGRIVPSSFRIVKQRNKTAAFDSLRSRKITEFRERCIEVYVFHDALAHLRLLAGHDDDEGDARADFKKRISLRPFPFLAQVITVIAPEDYDRLVAQVQTLQRVQHAPHLLVHETC